MSPRTSTSKRSVLALYTSVFDDVIVCTSYCRWDPHLRRVFAIDLALNADAADDANSVTDEYVTLSDGTTLRDSDGVTFDY